jgi:hypothetical protein
MDIRACLRGLDPVDYRFEQISSARIGPQISV